MDNSIKQQSIDTFVKIQEKINFLILAQEMMAEKYEENEEILEYIYFVDKHVSELTSLHNKSISNMRKMNDEIVKNYNNAIKDYKKIVVNCKEIITNQKG